MPRQTSSVVTIGLVASVERHDDPNRHGLLLQATLPHLSSAIYTPMSVF
jgi:hypothetical protein